MASSERVSESPHSVFLGSPHAWWSTKRVFRAFPVKNVKGFVSLRKIHYVQKGVEEMPDRHNYRCDF